MIKTAEFSPSRLYRYTLWRIWDESLPACMFIGLNPSTANETEDDPTIRRCINFARSWGYGQLVMTNLFAFRATNPVDMKSYHSPVGIMNNSAIICEAKKASIIVAAWGNHGSYKNRASCVTAMLPNLHYLEKSVKGQPKHPLYLKANLIPVCFNQMDFFK